MAIGLFGVCEEASSSLMNNSLIKTSRSLLSSPPRVVSTSRNFKGATPDAQLELAEMLADEPEPHSFGFAKKPRAFYGMSLSTRAILAHGGACEPLRFPAFPAPGRRRLRLRRHSF